MQTSMLKDDGHNNLWQATAADAPATTRLTGTASADVIIIGAGYTGLSTALHLQEAGLQALVLEAHEIGHGGSGRNVGLVNAGMWIKPDELIATLGEEWGQGLISLLGDAPGVVYDLVERFEISCEATRTGTLHMGVGRAGAQDLAERERQWQALGAPVALLDSSEAARLSGACGFAAALLDRRAGTIQPLSYARGLARAALHLGAQIFTQSPVTRIHDHQDCWRVDTAQGSVTAPWVVVATNAYSGLVPGFAFAGQQRELTLLPYFQCATTSLPPDIAATILPQRQGCWDTRLIMTSFRMDAQGRLIFGSVGALEKFSTATQQGFARRSLQILFPALGKVEFEAFWHGQIGMTADHLPKFHRLGRNIISVNGFNGRGIAPGTVFGKAMAHHIANEAPMPLPPAPIIPSRSRHVMTALYRHGSQLAHLAAARLPRAN